MLLCTTALSCRRPPLPSRPVPSRLEKQTIVITGTRDRDVGGVQTPDTTKAKAVLTQEMIAARPRARRSSTRSTWFRASASQTTIPTAQLGRQRSTSAASTRSRISLTFDGIPLNDSGNYAIFSNQQLDPELIEQVNVNLGSTDVDSPTASAAGGTVNYRTIVPTRRWARAVVGSLGDWNYRAASSACSTRASSGRGARARSSPSSQRVNDDPFNNHGKIDKQQFNARIYQPIGTNGDFISIAGHYNENRNNFFGSLPLRTDLDPGARPTRAAHRRPGLAATAIPPNSDERVYNDQLPVPDSTPVATRFGVADRRQRELVSCGTEFDRRYNPSNTGNVRGASRFTLADGLVLTVDPSYQYVKANGGGTVDARGRPVRDVNPAVAAPTAAARTSCRQRRTARPTPARRLPRRQRPIFGRDLNGDGDTLDSVTVLAPSQTAHRPLRRHRRPALGHQRQTRRSASAYTLDRCRHRQTGEVGLLKLNGEPFDVFPINDPICRRDRRHAREARPPVLRAPAPDLGRVSRRFFGSR